MSENSEQYFFNFSFFKVDPKWRWMADLAKEESAKEVENIISNSKIMFRSYSNCLLYTSPSPRDLSTSRMPSSA